MHVNIPTYGTCSMLWHHYNCGRQVQNSWCRCGPARLCMSPCASTFTPEGLNDHSCTFALVPDYSDVQRVICVIDDRLILLTENCGNRKRRRRQHFRWIHVCQGYCQGSYARGLRHIVYTTTVLGMFQELDCWDCHAGCFSIITQGSKSLMPMWLFCRQGQ